MFMTALISLVMRMLGLFESNASRPDRYEDLSIDAFGRIPAIFGVYPTNLSIMLP